MRKDYLPRPSGVPGTNNPRRVLSTVPIEIDLARSSDRFHCLQIHEPELLFSGGRRCVDPRTGLAAYGPYGVTRPEDIGQIRVGVVGTAEGLEEALGLLEEISQPVEQSPEIDCVLHPSFPGMNSLEPFRVHVVTQSQWHRTLRKRDLRSFEECGDGNTRRWLLQEIIGGEVRTIGEIENPPQVVICFVSETMVRALDGETSHRDGKTVHEETGPGARERISHRLRLEFQAGLKAECMGSLPTELIWPRPDSKKGGIPDRATRAWNLSLALLHKAGLIPWRLANADKKSCHIGISFCRVSGTPSSDTFRSFAQVVTELGTGFIVDGETFELGSPHGRDTEPHLEEGPATKLLSRALAVFENHTGIAPQKAVVHKSSPYSSAERSGFESALRNIPKIGLMTITRRGLFCMRPGRKPILRGLGIPFDGRSGLLFTSGYVPFLRAHFGHGMPKPLEITENWGSLSFQQSAEDLIRLTKLDLSCCDFCSDLPITMSHSREIAAVLRALGQKVPSLDDRYYV